MSQKKKQLKLVGYVRVSQVGESDQDDSLRSPAQQPETERDRGDIGIAYRDDIIEIAARRRREQREADDH